MRSNAKIATFSSYPLAVRPGGLGPPSPAMRRAVRENSGIGEAQLIFRVLALRTAWVDGRGYVDGAEVAAFEEARGDQIGKAQDRDLHAVARSEEGRVGEEW